MVDRDVGDPFDEFWQRADRSAQPSGSTSVGVGSRFWFKHEDIRIEVAMISEQQLDWPMPGLDDTTH